jgi:hypothetical protein
MVCSPAHFGLDLTHHRRPASEALDVLAYSGRVIKPEAWKGIALTDTIISKHLSGTSNTKDTGLDQIIVILKRSASKLVVRCANYLRSPPSLIGWQNYEVARVNYYFIADILYPN